jgi:hypothetical protein
MEDEKRQEDRRLIDLALQGDEKAYELLLNRYRNLVYSIINIKSLLISCLIFLLP